MQSDPSIDPALTVALALAAGIIAQSLARHLRIPGIVLLLGAGVLLGPDLLAVIHPASLGQGLRTLVGFAVAVILFEGGMNLNLRRLGHEAKSIRRLVTIGALVTALGGTLCARLILGWSWSSSVLFGTIVIVTGPTVITPLLRRLRVNRNLATVLEAEGVLVDAVGAIAAVVALEVVIGPSGGALAFALWDLIYRLGFGFALGLVGGYVIAQLLRLEKVVPEGFENIFTLSLALALFQASNAFPPESGIVTVAIAGIVVGNVKTKALSDLREFKEQLTILLIGMLFVLLAADVRVEEIRSLGWAGIWTVLALMFIVRPLNVAVSTIGSDFKMREKIFLSWIAPRGIVAAAVASLFAQTLSAEGLGVRRASNSGYVILGANDLSRAFGRVLRDAGQEVLLLESNPDACRAAEKEGFRVLYGTGLSESILQRADMDGRAGCLAITPNDGVNLLFARRAREMFSVPGAWVALRRGHLSVTKEMVRQTGSAILFGEPKNIELWTLRLERKLATASRFRRTVAEVGEDEMKELHDEMENLILPLALRRGKKILPMDGQIAFKKDDELIALILGERRGPAVEWLYRRGWHAEEEAPAESTDGARRTAAGAGTPSS